MDKNIKIYLEKQKTPQKEICMMLRKIIFRTLNEVNEEMRWGVVSYNHGKFYIAPLKNSVNLGFSIKGLSKDEMSNFNGSGKYMRHLKFNSVKEVDEKQVVELLKMVDRKAKCVSC